ncbi:hypothetical protein ACFQMA_13290 [Halosimplex aquaticum]|uniref:Uncharacterized protein n=1 Tax=Halosimplex aquaticum TaxID=3026162 RepID=A0ABD5Y5L3_9EURY|nr:hypothetical protein [Halosimplex aquaticum]
METERKLNVGLFALLAVGTVALVTDPTFPTAAVFVASTAVYVTAVRFWYDVTGRNPYE